MVITMLANAGHVFKEELTYKNLTKFFICTTIVYTN